MTESDDVAALKRRHRATWAAGRFDRIAAITRHVGEVCAERAGIEPGAEVLDVACGTGNATIPAARLGGRVTGLDLTPELLDEGRARAAEAGVEIEWVEGDAEALPFADASFDRVISTFGVMFAPRHEVAASELLRVCRPGGRIVLSTWPPGENVARMFELVARHAPPPPAGASSPLLWGEPEHLRSLFGGAPAIERLSVDVPLTPEAYVAHFEREFGPVVQLRERLEPEGRWGEVREEWLGVVAEFFRDDHIEQVYLVVGVER